jgi:glycosyltransferase involved in cell wall biosynthesis
MKRVLYRDFRFKYKIFAEYINPHEHYKGPDILFVSHELTLTGAPRMLFYAANAVRRNGGFPVVVSAADGPMREDFIKAGITVIIDESVHYNHFLFEGFARNFDLAIVNTVALGDAVRQLSGIPILKTIWWLHEAQSLSSELKNLQGVDWKCTLALCVSEYAKSFVPSGIPVEVLRNGIPDEQVAVMPRTSTSPMTFILSGTIEPRKGQDILVAAVALMPPDVRRQCRFLIAGKLWDGHQSFWKRIEEKMQNLPEIKYLGLLDHTTLLTSIAQADVVVCCSRDDPAPLIVAEAAMLSKPVILNNHVGQLEILDQSSCLVFETENAASLAEKLLIAYRNRDKLPEMGISARRDFERKMTISNFETKFMSMILNIIHSDQLKSSLN